ncbi:tumor necrosis factor ligand superfamily member 14 [Chaetodon auriga]|uniref:tumor necrosis factor ligand superfamily member 14 n=1 Tax=Chaetodon auriga TaxID=39042 RepID=UPI0040328A40
MAEGGYPPVYTVDSGTPWPPVPPRLSKVRRRAGAAQTLLFLLVSVALCGMAIEACFIYRLYQHESGNSASSSKVIAGEDDNPPTTRPSVIILPSKPVAHLTDGQNVVHEKHIMAWSMDADPLLYEMDYKNGSLLIQKEGFYYVYSKVSFSDTDVFYHSVELKTKLYVGKSIPLLMSRKYSDKISNKMRSNSYLGGVFHLHKDDALFVKVSNSSKVRRYKSFENIFGAYMI